MNESLKIESETALLRCPLCNCAEWKDIDHLSGVKIRELWKVTGHEFSEEAKDVTANWPINLHECADCGAFFEPLLAGGEKFYTELEHESYFSATRAELAHTIQFTKQKKLKRVLDVDCGSGFFLDSAKKSGFETFGIELNKAAAEKTRAKGHVVFENLLHELDKPKAGDGFDLVTFFQVLEHVSDPVGVLKEAISFLKPNGYIAIAVPYAVGAFRLVPYDPHQWPPHHVSRWRLADLRQLAVTVNMKLLESGGDILVGSQIEQVWNLHNQLAPVIGRPKRKGGKMFPKLASLVYRKTGMKYFFPNWGSSIYGYFQQI